MIMDAESSLSLLDRLVGTWTTEATHPAVPGTLVHGTAEIEWLEGERFLIVRSRTDHADFPDSISIIGFTDSDRVPVSSDARISMQYFDSRGVFRKLDVAIDATAWRIERLAPGFSQRFVGTFVDGGDAIDGRWQLCEDDVHWNDDLQITYRRKRD